MKFLIKIFKNKINIFATLAFLLMPIFVVTMNQSMENGQDDKEYNQGKRKFGAKDKSKQGKEIKNKKSKIVLEKEQDELPKESSEGLSGWNSLPIEMQMNVLYFLLKDIFTAIDSKDNDAISAIFKQYRALKLTSSSMNQLVSDQRLFNLEEIVKHFIKKYKNYFLNILTYAAKCGGIDIVESSLSYLSIKDMYHAFATASRCRQMEVCKKFIVDGGIFEGAENIRLIHAIYLHEYDRIRCLIQQGQVNARLHNKSDALMMAINAKNDIDIIRVFLDILVYRIKI